MDGSAARAVLEDRYRCLVLLELPARARRQGWVVTADHCFGRILLDHVVGGCWYDLLDRRRSPAFRQLEDGQLAAAVALAERVAAEGDPLLRELDARSLHWRGKAPRSPRGRDRGDRPMRPGGGVHGELSADPHGDAGRVGRARG